MEPKEQIKQRLDIADLISDYLPLKPAGSGSFKALCPFHSEKTPSFYISREKEIWHCFGCDMGGDIFSFVMEMDGMTFPEALRHLGKKAGVKIPEYRRDPKKDEKQFLYDLNKLAANFYEAVLHKHTDGAVAKEYIRGRGIDDDLSKTFRLGYAADEWEALSTFLKKRGFKDDRIIAAGLAKRTRDGKKIIDRFRGRLMIPLHDGSGRIVGFTARLIKKDAEGPKYLNSPETLIYHKSDVLYGLHLAKKGIRQQKTAIIVEGNLDVIASHKAEVTHIVASSGTALTTEQLRQLKKSTDTLLFAFDADAAGFQAAKRGMHLAQSLGMHVRVIIIPESAGKDPDDVVQKDPALWKNLVESHVPVMEYHLSHALAVTDMTRVEEKRRAAHALVDELSRLKDPVDRSHWRERVSDALRVPIDALKELESQQSDPAGRDKKSARTSAKNSTNASIQPRGSTASRRTKACRAADIMVGLLLCFPEIGKEHEELTNDELPDGFHREVYKNLRLVYTSDNSIESTQLSPFSLTRSRLQSEGREDLVNEIDRLALHIEQTFANIKRENVREEFDRHRDLLKRARTKKARSDMEAAIREAERVGDRDRLDALLESYKKFIS